MDARNATAFGAVGIWEAGGLENLAREAGDYA